MPRCPASLACFDVEGTPEISRRIPRASHASPGCLEEFAEIRPEEFASNEVSRSGESWRWEGLVGLVGEVSGESLEGEWVISDLMIYIFSPVWFRCLGLYGGV